MLVGIVGWRGMVGSVLIQRMLQEGDFNFFETRFFSTSNAGDKVPEKIKFKGSHILADGFDESALADCDVILTCQGSEYSRKMFPTLRSLPAEFPVPAIFPLPRPKQISLFPAPLMIFPPIPVFL